LKEKFKHSFKPIDDLKGIISDDDEDGAEEFETEEVKVVVKSLDLPRKRVLESSDDDEGELSDEQQPQDDDQLCSIKGMELASERKKKPESSKPSIIADQLQIGSKKDLKRLVRERESLRLSISTY
jgi:hypothetical protein